MEIIGMILATLFAQILKNKILPKFGDVGVHAILLGVALGWVALTTHAQGVQEFISQTSTIVAGAVGIYEILLKRLGINKLELPQDTAPID